MQMTPLRPVPVRATLIGVSLIATVLAGLLPASAAGGRDERNAERIGRHTPLRANTHQLITRAVARGEISEAQGALYLSYAFTDPEQVPVEYRSTTPWDGTLALLELQDTLSELDGGGLARRARSALRGPSFACPSLFGQPLPDQPQQRATKHFYIQYRNSSLRGLTINQYATALERTWEVEITEFGWARPPRDPVRSPKRGRYPVRIENLGNGLFGYVSTTGRADNNPATPWNDRDAQASCMVLNRNFVPFEGTPLAAMQATTAHEFNHSIQFGYGALSGYGRAATVLVEGGATWMEDEVFDGANDSWNYLWPNFTKPMGVYKGFPYPYWIVLRAMAEPFGTGVAGGGEDIYQTLWEEISKERSTNLTALNRAFKAKGSSLVEAYHNASIALRFLESCATTAPPYCLQEGPQYPGNFTGLPDDMYNLSIGGPVNHRRIANDFSLNWVGLPSNNDVDLVVDPAGNGAKLRVSIACLTGNTVTVHTVGTATGPEISLDNLDASLCDAATVVISNVKQTGATPRRMTKTTYDISVT